MPSIQRACLCRSRGSSRAPVRSASWAPTLCPHGTLCKGQVELCLVSGWRDPEKCAPLSRCRQSPGAGRCQEGRHICPEVRGPPRGEASGSRQDSIRERGGAESEKTNSLPAWTVLTHSHARVSEGHLQSDLHRQELPFVLFGDQIRSDKEQ